MKNGVEIMNSGRNPCVLVSLDRDYVATPRSKILKDALRKLQTAIEEQLDSEYFSAKSDLGE